MNEKEKVIQAEIKKASDAEQLNSSLRAEIENLTLSLTMTNTTLGSQLKDQDKTLQAKIKQLSEAEQKIKQLAEELQYFKGVLSDTVANNTSLRNQVKERDEILQAKKEQLSQAEKNNQHLSEENSGLQQTLEKLREQLSEKNCKDKTKQLTDVELKVKELSKQKSEMQIKIRNLKIKCGDSTVESR